MADQHDSLLAVYTSVVRRDLLLAYRHRGEFFNPLLFFLMVIVLFPLGLGPEPEKLSQLAPGIIWVVALLACLLSSDRLFRVDFDDGTLDQYLVSPQPLWLIALAKTTSHWLVTGLPLTIASPLLAVLLFLQEGGHGALFMSMAAGTVTLSMVGAVGAALTVGLRRGGVLLTLLILPLYTPVLIFGTAAVNAAVSGAEVSGYMAILLALMLLSVMFAPLAVGSALRISADN